MNLILTITELSNVTGKTRPTLYKYIASYEAGNLDDVPFTFIQLFNLMKKPNVTRKEIMSFCEQNFKTVDEDIRINEIISLLKNNANKIDLDELKKSIEKEILKWTTSELFTMKKTYLLSFKA